MENMNDRQGKLFSKEVNNDENCRETVGKMRCERLIHFKGVERLAGRSLGKVPIKRAGRAAHGLSHCCLRLMPRTNLILAGIQVSTKTDIR